MSASINRHLFTQTKFDSGDLTQLGFVVHQFNQSGRYKVDVYRHDQLRASCYIDVDTDYLDKQISLELSALDYGTPTLIKEGCCDDGEVDKVFRLDAEGYALFHVGKGSGGYRVKVYHLKSKDKDYYFDSTALNKGDLFGLTLLQPGNYSVIKSPEQTLFNIEVEAVKPGNAKYIPPEAEHIELDKLSTIKNIKMKQAQGIVFHGHYSDRIIVKMDDDGCENKGEYSKHEKAARWAKPSRKRRA